MNEDLGTVSLTAFPSQFKFDGNFVSLSSRCSYSNRYKILYITRQALILHTSKSTCNEHVKQYANEASKNVFRKKNKHQNFDLLWGPKWPRIWAFEAHVVHISESSSNEHIKQDYCEPRATFWTKYLKTWILPYLEAQNFWPPGPIFLHTYKIVPMSL